jgi:hypothetical protein
VRDTRLILNTDMTEIINVSCCFCGERLDLNHAVQVTLRPPEALDEIQTVYSHKQCLNKILHKDVPRHPDLLLND